MRTVAIVALALRGLMVHAEAQTQTDPVVYDSTQDVSPPLADIDPTIRWVEYPPPPGGDGTGSGIPEVRTRLDYRDPVLQDGGSRILAATAGSNFLAIGAGLGDLQPSYGTPSIGTAVGATQFVQVVNLGVGIFAVFDKSGALLYGPADGTVLWSGFPDGRCSTESEIHHDKLLVNYDQLAGRWVFVRLRAMENVGPTR